MDVVPRPLLDVRSGRVIHMHNIHIISILVLIGWLLLMLTARFETDERRKRSCFSFFCVEETHSGPLWLYPMANASVLFLYGRRADRRCSDYI